MEFGVDVVYHLQVSQSYPQGLHLAEELFYCSAFFHVVFFCLSSPVKMF